METMSAIQTYTPSSSLQLSTALLGIESALERAALANVALAGEGFTEAEKEAMTTIEELKLINGMDLAAVLLRGKLLRRIEERSMWSYHPARYGTLQEMAQDQGISVSNLSNIRDLNFVIFPWMTDHGLSVPEKWEQIGMSNFRELIPVLKSIITGEQSGSASVRQSVENILTDTAATLQSAAREGEGDVTDEEIRDAAIEELLTAGELMRNRDLRARIRPERTPSVNMDSFLSRDGTRFILAEVTEDQWTMIQRRLGAHIDSITIDVPDNPRIRQSAILTRPLVRKLNSLISG